MSRVISAQEFVRLSQNDQPRLRDSLRRWDRLYDKYEAEICPLRLAAYEKFFGHPLATRASIDLCRLDRYSACINLIASDGHKIHICDFLLISIGSRLDRKLRSAYWQECESVGVGARSDIRKQGLRIQNKNLHHFTVTIATNPKVAHIYRKSNKLHRMDSRVYYYNKNFRGNMFCLTQMLILLPCIGCLSRRESKHAVANGLNNDECQEPPLCVVVEELSLRNCFKQDYLILRRFCDSENGRRHSAVKHLLSKFVQQYKRQINCRSRSESSVGTEATFDGCEFDNTCVRELLCQLTPCSTFFERFSGSSNKSNDPSFDNDLRSFLLSLASTRNVRMDISKQSIDRVLLGYGNDNRVTSDLLFCDCDFGLLRRSFNVVADCSIDLTDASRFDDIGHMYVFLDNLQEFHKISMNCFVSSDEENDLVSETSDNCLGIFNERLYEQLFVLYCYMRDVIARNEDIDQLCNKCAFDGPYLYGKLCRQLSETLSRLSTDELLRTGSDIVSCYRRLALTANLYMLISSKTNIRVEFANDMKRSVKLSVKREKMRQTEYVASTTPRATDLMMNSSSNVLHNISKVSVGRSNVGSSNAGDENNEKCDFVIRASLKTSNMRTEISADGSSLYLASCFPNEILVRQLIVYNNQNLLQNISAAHFSDTEFVHEAVKRPNVANQHNSIKCSLMPLNSMRFLSYYNMGSLSSAGRTLNVCFRNTLTFFLEYENSTYDFRRWLLDVYSLVRGSLSDSGNATFGARSSALKRCVAHDVEKCSFCLRSLLVNEVPFVDMYLDKRFETLMFFLVKYNWPAVQFYRKTRHIINLTLISGVIMIPMIIEREDRSVWPRIEVASVAPLMHDVWIRCESCDRYFPRFVRDRASNVVQIPTREAYELEMLNDRLKAFVEPDRDGGIRYCEHHLWFSSNDLEYYETVVRAGRQLDRPFVYEIACHGLLLNCHFLKSTDISKLTVSINASRRRLRTSRCLSNGQLEVLIDQNSRMCIRSWRTRNGYPEDSMPGNESRDRTVRSIANVDVPDDELEPLDEILELKTNNLFRCCFMFGDFEGRNCEDAYVFDSNSRPLLDNLVQLKINFYRTDKLAVSMESLRVDFSPTCTVRSCGGANFYLGSLISHNKLSFGSTFVHVKTVQITPFLYEYRFYYNNNASYLRPGERVFRDAPLGLRFVGSDEKSTADESSERVYRSNSEGCRLLLPKQTCATRDAKNRSATVSSSANDEESSNSRVLEGEKTTANGMIRVCYRTTCKQIRFLIEMRGVRSVLKWQNSCGNKGVSTCVSLDDLQTSRGGRVHVIVSPFSMIGRQLVAQCLEQRSVAGSAKDFANGSYLMPVYSKSANFEQVGWAGYGDFFFSCDSPHDTIIVSSPDFGNNATRFCNMTRNAGIGYGLSTWLNNRWFNHVNYRTNPINAMSESLEKCLKNYHFYLRQVYPLVKQRKEYRKKMKDHFELSRRNINSSLPLSFPDVGSTAPVVSSPSFASRRF